MWSLEVINYRNQAHSEGLTAYEVNFLHENKIFPVVGCRLSKESIEKIQAFKDKNGDCDHGKDQ